MKISSFSGLKVLIVALGLFVCSCSSDDKEFETPSEIPESETGDEFNPWQPLDSGMDDPVMALLQYKGNLIAGGRFGNAGGEAVESIAQWDGVSWSNVGSGIERSTFGEMVYSLEDYDGVLIAAGWFDTAGGETLRNIASWDGSEWQGLGNGRTGETRTLANFGGDLIAGGYVVNYEGEETPVAKWNGTEWDQIGHGMNGTVWDLLEYDGELIAGGDFRAAGEQNVNYIAAWNGNSWKSLHTGLDGSVIVLTIYRGELIAGGEFFKAGELTVNNIARWNGVRWQTMGEGILGYVTSFAVHNDKLFAAGRFSEAGGEAASNIAVWDGDSWSPVGPGFNAGVTSLTVYNETLVAGGFFSHAGKRSVQFIARYIEPKE